MAESDRLAQANLSRPGESYRGSPKCFPREESPRLLKSEQHACMSFTFKSVDWMAGINGVVYEL